MNGSSTGTNSIAVFRAPIANGAVPSYYLNGLTQPGGLIFDAQGNLYASNNPSTSTGAIVRYNSTNLASGATPNIVNPTGLGTAFYEAEFAFDAAGNLYAADCGTNSSAGIRVYANAATSFSATQAPSLFFTDAQVTGIGCAWGIVIR